MNGVRRKVRARGVHLGLQLLLKVTELARELSLRGEVQVVPPRVLCVTRSGQQGRKNQLKSGGGGEIRIDLGALPRTM